MLSIVVYLQDGRICEAVAWELGPSQRHCIPDCIVAHILKRHLPGTEVQAFGGCFDWVLQQARSSAEEQVTAQRFATQT